MLSILKKYWGFDEFRPMQSEIIQAVLDGNDTLALLPTGGGKSICFQVPALKKEGICIVVSPLIALMRDQVENLKKRDISAIAIYSGMHYTEIDKLLDNCVYGKVKFLYLSPERLMTDIVRERIRRMPVNLIAVDEAHCISQWGYDFRPPYLKIAEIRDILPDVPVIALTATATPEVVIDIQDKLEFKKPKVFQKSFERSNLAYVVLQEENKVAKVIDILQKVRGSGIVYVRSRRRTKDIALYLQKRNIRADFYHAGLTTDERAKKQEDWIHNRIDIMVSTNAFGMGIDKPDVRTVIHIELPDSLEAYFQEAGRAGRDGKKSYAVLLYQDQDRLSLEKNYVKSFPEIKKIRQIYRALGSYFQLAVGDANGDSYDFDLMDFSKKFSFEVLPTFQCLKILEQEGWLQLSDAIYIPSKVQIIIDKEQLYDYQLRNPNADILIKVLLRTSQGLFHHLTAIQEHQIARVLKTTAEKIVIFLNLLKQEGIIEYLPKKEQPQITWLQERVSADNFTIDYKKYKFRKKQYYQRVKAAINYARYPLCRSQQLLSYFGQKDIPICGICDVCTGRTETNINDRDFERYEKKIFQVLKKEQLNLKELASLFGEHRKIKVSKVIEYLLDNGSITVEEGFVVRK